MRYQAFSDDAPLDCQPCQFPWNSEVTFYIWRSGRRQFADRRRERQIASAPKMLAWVAKKRGLTISQLDGREVDLQAEFGEMSVEEAIEQFGPEIVGLSGSPDIEGIALYLVDRVEGPLILADKDGSIIGWHDADGDVKHCGIAFLTDMPDEMSEWIVTEADRIEAEFQAFVGSAAGNSQTTSAISEAEVAEVEH